MDTTLQTGGNMLDRIMVTLTRRDVALVNLCLGVVARDHARGGNLRSDIESLQTRLAQYHSASSTARQTGCVEECGCTNPEHEKR